jgi:hypothetical protein
MEISIAGKNGRPMPPGDGGDHAVDQAPGDDTDLPASAVEAHGTVEIGRCIEAVQVEPLQ